MIAQNQDEKNKDAMIDDAIRKSMSKMVRKSDKFAARLSMTKNKYQ